MRRDTLVLQSRSLRLLWWLTLLLAIGPSWTVSRDLWDGVVGAYGMERHDFSGIHDWLIPGNWYLTYLLFRLIAAISDLTFVPTWVEVRLLLTVSLIGISGEARQLCSDVLHWNERDSRAAGVLVLAFPCWYLLYGSTFTYILFIWWVLLGHRWLHSSRQPNMRVIAGFVLMLAAFQVNSNFVMVFALEAVRWLFRDRREAWLWWRSALVALSAVIVYLALRLLFPPTGLYAGYNNFVFPFSRDGLISWVRAALMFLTWVPLIAAPAAAAWLCCRYLSGAQKFFYDGRTGLAVAIWFAGALIAYMAVGKGAPLFVINLPLEWIGTVRHLGRATNEWFYTGAQGWSTRHAFLFSVPAAIATVYFLRIVTVANGQAGFRSWWIGMAMALIANGAWMAHGHEAKLKRLAQEESIIRGLQTHASPPPGRLDLQLPLDVGWSVWTYEANYWTWLAYRRSAWAVAAYPAGSTQDIPFIRDRETAVMAPLANRSYYLMNDFQPTVCRTTWLIKLPVGLKAWSWFTDQLGFSSIPAAVIREDQQYC